MLAFGEDDFQAMLLRFAQSMPKPKAVVFVSAHTVSSETIHVSKTKKNRISHDFSGFPPELYQVQYQCDGDPELAERMVQLLQKGGFQTRFDEDAPLDHGIWVPMLHLYPDGDIPVVRVSLPLNLSPALILKMGHTLASLREQGVMLVASGGAVHNLRELRWAHKTGDGATWAKEFEDWLITTISKKNVDAIITAEEHPLFFQSHPSQEHFLPILFTIGAALPKDEFTILHRGIEYFSLSMLCFALNSAHKNAEKKPLH